jgi:hypothetical protein
MRKTKSSPAKPSQPISRAKARKVAKASVAGGWTFLTNHAHVLICLTFDPHALLRDVAQSVGVTERAVQGIVKDLESAGVLSRSRNGRRNVYQINAGLPLRHPIEAHRTVADLLDALVLR